MTITRIPAGVTTGGRFAARVRAESPALTDVLPADRTFTDDAPADRAARALAAEGMVAMQVFEPDGTVTVRAFDSYQDVEDIYSDAEKAAPDTWDVDGSGEPVLHDWLPDGRDMTVYLPLGTPKPESGAELVFGRGSRYPTGGFGLPGPVIFGGERS